ncbi:hypothetical protein [Amycolatopsis suaedae]|uniref:Uncharacterized protein n=1 Tax=Amycolatopsis suaedae TaxID=2510978 RepID=A0A4Q7J3E1_9PSEU|nr:hypothetical protein [Amycolatopsis suaedae]RZQ62011.1 hypothetical protein EWH70_20660 [Amycolatopsis suaedae]
MTRGRMLTGTPAAQDVLDRTGIIGASVPPQRAVAPVPAAPRPRGRGTRVTAVLCGAAALLAIGWVAGGWFAERTGDAVPTTVVAESAPEPVVRPEPAAPVAPAVAAPTTEAAPKPVRAEQPRKQQPQRKVTTAPKKKTQAEPRSDLPRREVERDPIAEHVRAWVEPFIESAMRYAR